MQKVTYSLSEISGKTKAEIIDLFMSNQAENQIPVFRAIPAVPATEAEVKDGITVKPATEAVPAKTIREQILSGTTYAADIEAIDKENETARANYESNPEVAGILQAKKNAAEFQATHKDSIAKIAELNNANVDAAKKMATASPSVMKTLRTEIAARNSEIEALEATVTYPADYDLSFEDVPAFEPKPYPSIDTYFPDGITGNFSASFLFGTKKSAEKKTGAKSTEATENKGVLTDEAKEEIKALRAANLAAGNTPGKGLSAIEKKYDISHGTAGGYIATLNK